MITAIKLERGIVGQTKDCPFYRIYHNMTTGDTWCNVYASSNSWHEYHDKDILQVSSGHGKRSIFQGDGMTKTAIIEAVEHAVIYHKAFLCPS